MQNNKRDVKRHRGHLPAVISHYGLHYLSFHSVSSLSPLDYTQILYLKPVRTEEKISTTGRKALSNLTCPILIFIFATLVENP